VKSTPISSFEKGRIYVVEFWATWCPPCRETIPHLTQLAKKFQGKAIFAGISISEQPVGNTPTGYYATVKKFVADEGAKMDYHVAVDGPKGTMAQNWMQAAGEDGIPTAFIVDKSGKIAWIGYPTSLEDPLNKIIAGKYDAKAALATRQKEQSLQANTPEKLLEPLGNALNQSDWPTAVKESDKVLGAHPELHDQVAPAKMYALLKSNEPEAYVYAKAEMTGASKANADLLNTMAQMVLIEVNGPKTPDLGLAQSLAQQAVDLTKSKQPEYLDTLAKAQYRNGSADKAIATEQQAIDLVNADKKIPPQAATTILNELNSNLAKYKTKKA
jgi:thiol-disulfide isomerase/thioredoxin